MQIKSLAFTAASVASFILASVHEARKLVREGAIGKFRGLQISLSTPTDYITSRPDHWANKLPGGVFGESGPHVIYMTLAFINPVQKVSVEAKKLMEYPWSPFEDYRIELIGETAISSIKMMYATKQWMARVEIMGEEGNVDRRSGGNEPCQVSSRGAETGADRDVDPERKRSTPEELGGERA